MSSSGGSRLRCGATTSSGEPCRAWAVRGSDRCAAHSGVVGAPAGNQNARKHGFYSRDSSGLSTIDGVIADLARRQEQLTDYLERVLAQGGDVADIARVFALHGQNASRLGRLLRDQRALSGKSADGLLDAIGKALDEIGTELGVRL